MMSLISGQYYASHQKLETTFKDKLEKYRKEFAKDGFERNL